MRYCGRPLQSSHAEVRPISRTLLCFSRSRFHPGTRSCDQNQQRSLAPQPETLDYAISQVQHITVRSFYLSYNQPTNATPGNILAFADGTTGKYFNELINHTWTISPTLVNSFGASWVQLDGGAGGPVKYKNGQDFCLSQIINVASPPNHCILVAQSVTNGFSTAYASPYTLHRTAWGPIDTISKTVGRHFVSGGINAYHQMSHEVSTWPVDPPISFGGGG
jgi:hypothetical protein